MNARPSWLRPETCALLEILESAAATFELARTPEHLTALQLAEADLLEAVRADVLRGARPQTAQPSAEVGA